MIITASIFILFACYFCLALCAATVVPRRDPEAQYAREQGEGCGLDGKCLAAFCLMLAAVLGTLSALRCAMVRRWYRCVGWLTIHHVCSWCKQRQHFAPLGFVNRSRVGNTSHTICPLCLARQKRELERITRGQILQKLSGSQLTHSPRSACADAPDRLRMAAGESFENWGSD